MTRDDLAPALALQSAAYPAFLIEPEAAFASRITLSTACCLVAKADGALIGYLLAHGWPSQSPPAVGAILSDPGLSECLYLHDLAVSAQARGIGLGERLVNHAFAIARKRRLTRAELIAVEGAAPYWRRLGFTETRAQPALRAKLATYGDRTRWMTRSIA